jgi:hypothetical protein
MTDNAGDDSIVQLARRFEMHRPMTRFTALVFALSALSCSTMSVRTDFDTAFDWNTADSVALFDRPGEPRRPQMSELVDRRIASAIASELGDRGLDVVRPRDADLLVTFYTAVRQQVVVNRAGWYGCGRRGWCGGATRISSYPEGTLIIDIIDRRRRELVWRGVGESAFQSMQPSDERVAKRVARVLATFPPTG